MCEVGKELFSQAGGKGSGLSGTHDHPQDTAGIPGRVYTYTLLDHDQQDRKAYY